MQLFELLRYQEPNFGPKNAKIHLARFNGKERPLDVFIAGQFDEWQAWQQNKNFSRPYVLSLVDAGSGRWLFAGVFRVSGCHAISKPAPHYEYDLERLPGTEEYVGRLFVTSSYKSRSSYLLRETLQDDLLITELLPQRVSFGRFPGFKAVNLRKAELDIVVAQGIESWKAALSSVKGIYLITDTSNGKKYVGKADGANGLWQRWCTYAVTSHGNNVALVEELGVSGRERQKEFCFSVLEIADLQSTSDEIARRENHWKEVLQTRKFGYNRN